MHNSLIILLLIVIAALVVLVIVLLGVIVHSQDKLNDKNEAIIREIRENIELRDELQRRLSTWGALIVLFLSTYPYH